MMYNNETQLLQEMLATMKAQILERDYKIRKYEWESSGRVLINKREFMKLLT